MGPGIQYIFLGFCIQDSNSFLMASNIGIGYGSSFFTVKKEFYRKNMNLSFSFFNNFYPKDKWIDGTLPNSGFWPLKAYLWSISGHYFLEYGLVWCLAVVLWWRADGPLTLRFSEAWRDTAEVVFLSDTVFCLHSHGVILSPAG